jgi:hypothetical protein
MAGYGLVVLSAVYADRPAMPDSETTMSETIITGVFDIGRGDIHSPFARPVSFYLDSLSELLRTDQPLIIYTQKRFEDFVRLHRTKGKTAIRIVELEDIEKFPFFEKIQAIRTSESWVRQAAWLKDSPQYQLAHYVPLMMMRLHWLRDEAGSNPFKTDRIYWLDGGILSNWRYRVFGEQVIKKRIRGRRFLVYSFPYRRSAEIHGFPRSACARFCGVKAIRWVCRGGLCGGPLDYVHAVSKHIGETMSETLSAGYMGTDENLLTIMAHRNPELISRRMILRDRLSFLGPLYARYRKWRDR